MSEEPVVRAPGEQRSRDISWASSPSVRRSMQGNRSRDTGLEVRLRRELHRRGLRYRVQFEVLPRRKVDVAFTRARVVVEARGCFWHSCPEHATHPQTNSAYWQPKLVRNQRRDAELAEALAGAGWQLVVVWEHEDLEAAAEAIAAVVVARRGQRFSQGGT